jgi:hypothetical protein
MFEFEKLFRFKKCLILKMFRFGKCLNLKIVHILKKLKFNNFRIFWVFKKEIIHIAKKKKKNRKRKLKTKKTPVTALLGRICATHEEAAEAARPLGSAASGE